MRLLVVATKNYFITFTSTHYNGASFRILRNFKPWTAFSQGCTGTSTEWRLMQENVFCKKPPSHASASSLVRARFDTASYVGLLFLFSLPRGFSLSALVHTFSRKTNIQFVLL